MSIWGKKHKVCATCIYWGVEKNTFSDYIEPLESNGQCNCKDGMYNLDTNEGNKCDKYKECI